jgi:hypothetical protein
MLPMADSSCENTVSLSPSTDPEVPGLHLILPPALKKCLILSAVAKVTDLSMVDVEFHVPLLVLVLNAFVVVADVLVHPPFTDAANVAKSVATAALILIGSPAVT